MPTETNPESHMIPIPDVGLFRHSHEQFLKMPAPSKSLGEASTAEILTELQRRSAIYSTPLVAKVVDKDGRVNCITSGAPYEVLGLISELSRSL